MFSRLGFLYLMPMTSDPRYPIGRFARPAEFTAASRTAAISTIAAAPARFREAVRGFSDAQLDTPYRDDGWTVRQLIHHVADSHMNAYVRVRLALTEESPVIKPYEEQLWAELPDAKTMPVEVSLSLIDGIHERWTALLRTLSPEQWARTLTHPVNGPMTLDSLTALYAWHSDHHTAHVTELKKSRGW
jgi:uncharacterized damage-inducible protein DinB